MPSIISKNADLKIERAGREPHLVHVKQRRKAARHRRKGPVIGPLLVAGAIAGMAFWMISGNRAGNRPVRPELSAPATNASAGVEQANPSAGADAFFDWLTNQTEAPELLNAGTALLDEGRLTEAILCYHRALELRPQDEEANFNLGFAYAKAGSADRAIHYYREALKVFPEYVEAHNNLGNLLIQQRRNGEAIEHFTEALKLNPEHSLAHNNLGRALAEQGQPREAMTHFLEAVRLDPEYAEAHLNLGSAYLALGRTNEAVSQITEVLRLRPGFPPALQLLSRIRAPQK